MAVLEDNKTSIEIGDPSLCDTEQQVDKCQIKNPRPASAFKSLGVLDRFLAVWILLAMVIGILLGNFVSSVGPALQKGQFVGVSVPIGMVSLECLFLLRS